MKLREILRFELAYQLRRPWPWLCMAVMLVFAFANTRIALVPATLTQEFILNSPFIIATVTVFTCMIWLLIAPAVAGEAAARDVETGLHPLIYTAPVSRLDYLGGRFLAALILHALILLMVQVGSLLAAFAPGVNPEIIGPFRPAAYLGAYVLIALPNALIATTFQFSAALFTGRWMASYAGSMALFFLSVPVTVALYFAVGLGDRALLFDPIGMFAIMNEMMLNWTLVEKNVRPFHLDGAMLANRLLWVSVSVVALALTYLRFRFAHRTSNDLVNRIINWFTGRRAVADVPATRVRVAVPAVRQSFGFAVHVRQLLAIGGSSVRMLAATLPGLFLLVAFPMFVVLVLVVDSEHWGVPLLLRTGNVLADITGPITLAADFRAMIPLLIVYFAGELVWRERDARLSENIDATAVPEWVIVAGKYLGLALLLAGYVTSMMLAGIVAQLISGFRDIDLPLYLQVMYGLQLPDYLLFAALALVVHTVVNHKQVGLFAALVAYFLIIFAPMLRLEHKLLVYTAGPDWTYTDIRGFGFSIVPWLWFKLYWAAWAVLLGVAARLLWVRGRESGFRTRLRIARQRCTRRTAAVAAMATMLVLVLGGFIFYNTNVLHDYRTSAQAKALAAEYERRYGKYEGAPQPWREATKLHIEIHPKRGAAQVRGTYLLVNRDDVPIDSVHVETVPGFVTRLRFDRPATVALEDRTLRHSIHVLHQPLQPGDSVTLTFELDIEPRGFDMDGAPTPIVPNGTHFSGRALPVIGYQPARELIGAADRSRHGLPRQVTFPAPDDVQPEVAASTDATFEAVIGTDADQVAVGPGVLRRSWTEGARRYFHYTSGVPIRGLYMFFSADYAVHTEQWNGVEIQLYNDPRHTELRERVLRSVRASLDYFSAQFGRYPYPFLQVIEQPAKGMGMGVDGSAVVTGLEGFFRLNPQDEDVDAVFQITAHEMAHQWWGVQLRYAPAEGAIVLSEGLAWYSAIMLMKHTHGVEPMREFMSHLREPMPWPQIRTGLPLLRAMDPWAGYRKTPYALVALAGYMGEARVNAALAGLLRSKAGQQATTLDLYRELQAVTPDSLQYLLHDLFEVNTFWELDAQEASARQTAAGTWEVRLQLHARKVVSDSAGTEAELAMDEWIPIGIFAQPEQGRRELSAPLHLQMHRIRAGGQTLTIEVPGRPVLAGIDPHHLLDWVEDGNDDNIAAVTIPADSAAAAKRGGK